MKCRNCDLEITEDESYSHCGSTFCEDCYLEAVSRVKACDPRAVHHARSVRENLIQEPSESLNGQQTAIYEYIKRRGKVSPLELFNNFGLSPR